MTTNKTELSIEEAAGKIRAAGGSIYAMMEAVGLDPRHDFRGGDFRKSTFSPARDVAGYDFTNALLNGADLSLMVNIELANFRGADLEGAILPEGITVEMLTGDESVSIS